MLYPTAARDSARGLRLIGLRPFPQSGFFQALAGGAGFGPAFDSGNAENLSEAPPLFPPPQ